MAVLACVVVALAHTYLFEQQQPKDPSLDSFTRNASQLDISNEDVIVTPIPAVPTTAPSIATTPLPTPFPTATAPPTPIDAATVAATTPSTSINTGTVLTSNTNTTTNNTCPMYDPAQHPTDQKSFPRSVGTCNTYTPRSDADRDSMEASVQRADWTRIRKFVLFFGFGRSGHSWIGSVLDAAPNAIIANEWDVVRRFGAADHWPNMRGMLNHNRNWVRNKENFTKQYLYDDLARNSYICGLYGRKQIYDYTIPGLWQGHLEGNIDVIGDKKGGGAAVTFLQMGRAWENENVAKITKQRFDSMMDTVTDHGAVEPRLIIVLRHPFDLIATQTARETSSMTVSDGMVTNKINQYKFLFWATQNLGQPSHWHILTNEDFAHDTRNSLQQLCDFSGIQCPEEMHAKVMNQTHHNPHPSRYQVRWTKDQVDRVSAFISEKMSDYYSPCFDDPLRR